MKHMEEVLLFLIFHLIPTILYRYSYGIEWLQKCYKIKSSLLAYFGSYSFFFIIMFFHLMKIQQNEKNELDTTRYMIYK